MVFCQPLMVAKPNETGRCDPSRLAHPATEGLRTRAALETRSLPGDA